MKNSSVITAQIISVSVTAFANGNVGFVYSCLPILTLYALVYIAIFPVTLKKYYSFTLPIIKNIYTPHTTSVTFVPHAPIFPFIPFKNTGASCGNIFTFANKEALFIITIKKVQQRLHKKLNLLNSFLYIALGKA